MKPIARLGAPERSVVEARRADGYAHTDLQHFHDHVAETLRSLLTHLLPGVPATIDLGAFVDTHLDVALGRGDQRSGMPPTPQLILDGVTAAADNNFLDMTSDEQRDVIRQLRRGELGDIGKEFIDRLFDKALQGYLAHPDTWARIGFNGPAYPEGYAWIDTAEVAARHDKKAGWDKL